MSQIRTSLSAPAVTTFEPSRLNSANLTSSGCRKLNASAPVFAFQAFTNLSVEAVRIRAPSALKTAELISLPWAGESLTTLKECASQILKILPAEAVTTCEPSGLNAANVTTSSCGSVPRGIPVLGSQIQANRSREAVTTRDPSKLNITEDT